jgi:phosphate transport system permease protein
MASGVRADFTRRRMRLGEFAIEVGLFLAAATAVFVTIAIAWTLVSESAHFFENVPLSKFLTDTVWSPLFENPRYGIAPLLVGSLLTALVALSLAIPLGLSIAVYLSEFAPGRVREVVKPVLELIGSVPTVIFGYFALTFVTPLLRSTLLPDLPTFNVLSAGLMVGVLVTPFIASLSEDAMRSVPRGLKEGSMAMGATRLETATNVVFPAAVSGIAGAVILAISAAIGETMIVTIAGGQKPNFTLDPTESTATVTAYIAQVAVGDVAADTLEFYSIFAAGSALLVLTLALNLLAFWLQRRFREIY